MVESTGNQGIFFMISSNLIKSDDESVIEIRQFDILGKRTRKRIHGIKKSMNLNLILQRNQRLNIGDFFENKNCKVTKLRMKFNQITILKQN